MEKEERIKLCGSCWNNSDYIKSTNVSPTADYCSFCNLTAENEAYKKEMEALVSVADKSKSYIEQLPIPGECDHDVGMCCCKEIISHDLATKALSSPLAQEAVERVKGRSSDAQTK